MGLSDLWGDITHGIGVLLVSAWRGDKLRKNGGVKGLQSRRPSYGGLCIFLVDSTPLHYYIYEL